MTRQQKIDELHALAGRLHAMALNGQTSATDASKLFGDAINLQDQIRALEVPLFAMLGDDGEECTCPYCELTQPVAEEVTQCYQCAQFFGVVLGMRRRNVDLPGITARVVGEFSAELLKKGVLIDEGYDFLPNLFIDPELIKRLLQATISRAAKFCLKGDALWIRVLRTKGNAVVQVAHQGRGVLQGDLVESMFVPFKVGEELDEQAVLTMMEDYGVDCYVKSEDSWAEVFVFSFPMTYNSQENVELRYAEGVV